MKKRNNVCIISSAHIALDVRVFHKQAKSLAEAGYNVTLIAQHAKNEVADGVKIVAVQKPRNRFDRFLLTTLKVFIKALSESIGMELYCVKGSFFL